MYSGGWLFFFIWNKTIATQQGIAFNFEGK